MMHWYDVSNANSPYNNRYWDVAWDGYENGQKLERPGGVFGLGQEEDASAPVAVEEVVDVESLPCDLSSGNAVLALQEALNAEGAAISVTGVFDDATCAAWTTHFGEPPTAESIVEVMLPGVRCDAVVMPTCVKERRAGWGFGKTLFVAAAIAGGLVVARKVLRR